jgi:hypothetical protein
MVPRYEMSNCLYEATLQSIERVCGCTPKYYLVMFTFEFPTFFYGVARWPILGKYLEDLAMEDVGIL